MERDSCCVMPDSRINKWWCNVLDSGSNQTPSLSKQITLMLKYSSNNRNVLWSSDMCCKSRNSPWPLWGLEWRSWSWALFSVALCSSPDYFISLVTLIELDSSLKVRSVWICADMWLVNSEFLFYKSGLILFSIFIWRLQWYICSITYSISSNTSYWIWLRICKALLKSVAIWRWQFFCPFPFPRIAYLQLHLFSLNPVFFFNRRQVEQIFI